MKLISMTDFVFSQNTQNTSARRLSEIIGYATFLKRPLTIGMFVPCDDDGNVLELYTKTESEQSADAINRCRFISKEESKWNKAQSKVVFEGFATSEAGGAICDKSGIFNIFWLIDNNWKLSKGIKTIEDLVSYNLDLTGSF